MTANSNSNGKALANSSVKCLSLLQAIQQFGND